MFPPRNFNVTVFNRCTIGLFVCVCLPYMVILSTEYYAKVSANTRHFDKHNCGHFQSIYQVMPVQRMNHHPVDLDWRHICKEKRIGKQREGKKSICFRCYLETEI